MTMRRTIFAIAFFFIAVMSTYAQHKFDAAYPDVHDPVMAQGEDGRYYIFSTGMGVSVMSSADMKTWQEEKSVFPFQHVSREDWERGVRPEANPKWAADSIYHFMGHVWAPDIVRHNGLWYLYYSCSSFGKNSSGIGVATNKTLDPTSSDFLWEDHGPVIISHKHQDNWNAIDPNIAFDAETGAPYMVYGSFWDGIQLVKLDASMTKPVTKPVTVARRVERALKLSEVDDEAAFTIEGNDTIEAGENSIEGPFIIRHDGWYYLFVSWDYCCRGKNSTYKTVYGRSRNIEGPYLDMAGKPMAYGGGTLLVGPDKRYYGVGHCSAYDINGQWYFLSHAYDSKYNSAAKIFLRKMTFRKDGSIKLSK